MPRPVTNWRAVLRHAWSIRLIALAGLLSGIEVALPLFSEALSVPAVLFAWLSLVITAAAFIARIIAQKEFDGE